MPNPTRIAAFALAVALAAAAAPHAAASETLRFRLEVDPAGVARDHTPVGACLEIPAHLTADQAAQFATAGQAALRATAPGRDDIPAQLEPVRTSTGQLRALNLWWIEPDLPANRTKTYELVLRAPRQPDRADWPAAFRFADGDGFRDLFHGDRPVYRHMLAYDPARHVETYKPFHHVYGFHGDGFISKGAGGRYPHHRGLFLGWNRTRAGGGSFDFWHCKGVAQRHRRFIAERELTGPVFARTAAVTDWTDPDDRAVARDTRELTAWLAGNDRVLLDFFITIESAAGQVALGGDAHHAGFHFRAADEVNRRAAETIYLRPPTATGGGNDVWQNCSWTLCRFPIGEHSYAVMHMDHPGNPRPTTWSTRDYGRFGAFFTATVAEDEPLPLRYRILVLDAARLDTLTVAWCDSQHAQFTTPARVTVTPLK
jgi:hypothetical protein